MRLAPPWRRRPRTFSPQPYATRVFSRWTVDLDGGVCAPIVEFMLPQQSRVKGDFFELGGKYSYGHTREGGGTAVEGALAAGAQRRGLLAASKHTPTCVGQNPALQ